MPQPPHEPPVGATNSMMAPEQMRALRRFVTYVAIIILLTLSVAPRSSLAAIHLGLTPASANARLQTGVYIPGGAQDTRLLDRFEALTGQPVGIVQWYQPWGANYAAGSAYQPQLDSQALWEVSERGGTPLITWEAWGTVNGSDPSRVETIPTGIYDNYIDSWAIGLRDFGRPVYVRLFHELNNQSYPWAYGHNGNSAADLIEAWRYVHDRFESHGATNVEWVWAPSTENRLVKFRDIYPGDDYVDWLGVDGYNGGSVYPEWWGGWVTPTEVFEHSFNSFAAINPHKPIMIVETSTVEQGGDKADWISELYLELPERFPQLHAILWFNAAWGERPQANWFVDSSSRSLKAYRDALEEIARQATNGYGTGPGGRRSPRMLDLISPF